MQHATQVELLKRTLALMEHGISDCAETPSSLSASTYLDEARFRRERDQILRREPLLVARSSEIPNGHFLTRDLLAPLLLTRDNDGQLRAFLNICKHRGTQLVSDLSGPNRVFVCPYHAWSYNPDGQLRGMPHAYGFEGIERGCLNLTEVPVAERWGAVWASHTPGPALDLDTFFGEQLLADFASFGVESHVVFDPRDITRPVNWKLTIDTFLENYHVQKAHQATIDHLFWPNLGLFERCGRHIRNYYVKRNLRDLLDQPESAWNLRLHGNLLYYLWPNTLVLVEPDHIDFTSVFPAGPLGTRVLSHTLLATEPASEKALRYFQKNNEILYNALEEDFGMAARVQAGIQAGASDRLWHGRFEPALKWFHQGLDTALGELSVSDVAGNH
ncbi:aromatic ring-hydroxylating oxygenase subunit alpha [Pseudomonas sp. N040]|uniref:aromatic ring-hydroxylating oxygenase subunit alpha n=1 Tax=Pseudomonas sp. N040 TaxID=2785325 RepID=UPI0018A33105|nr:SRPBCC family protein [Pseudomonas sp. N040]MBF7729237.1 Rieske 2Fe-2S domain-containing protein [Pseudomonas sp. N040]MBW7012877.1 Rieske 2Fe-2S domain-containing protein [Pseudomonas sp. N040]